MNHYDIGDWPRLEVAFTNSAGIGVDPSTVTFQYRLALADPTSYTTIVFGVGSIVKASTGNYYTDYPVNSHGEHKYRWNGLGVNPAAVESAFQVRVRNVG